MTKFILAGGSDSQYPNYWQELDRVLASETSNKAVLSCMFSRDIEDRTEAHHRFDHLFKEHLSSVETIVHATEEKFYDQIDQTDIVYLHGGSTEKLLAAIPDTSKFLEAVKGKIVIGSSAGANFLSKACYSPSKQALMNGSGILPVGVVVHYGVDSFKEQSFTIQFWQAVADEVRGQLSIEDILLLLHEGQFVLIQQ